MTPAPDNVDSESEPNFTRDAKGRRSLAYVDGPILVAFVREADATTMDLVTEKLTCDDVSNLQNGDGKK